MNQERIFKQIPKQRTAPPEQYQQPFPVPEVDVEEVQALGDLVLEHIDEVLDEL